MKSIKKIAAAIILSLVSSVSFAQTVTATASTLDAAEAKIAASAKQAGARYSITEAYSGNQVHMTARLTR
ncbi:DUF1471 domain-containing protein [Pantoea conspicua]|uniref:DUF1471 domain-containing protein n=1 Tax=Pantoea conspicua TaxID=472705 RepID=A0A1X1BX50_9GAMM|nr:YdgH/BhsA/McbA-like domain containing protein [Pantoea conspicua]ORM53322.1 DUF1471 domain-containing protein [Pantoea conspicua]